MEREWPIEDLNYAIELLNANSKIEDDIFIPERTCLELKLATAHFRIGQIERGFDHLQKYEKHVDILCGLSNTEPRRGSVQIFEDFEKKLSFNSRNMSVLYFNIEDKVYDPIREDKRFADLAVRITESFSPRSFIKRCSKSFDCVKFLVL